MTIKQIIMFAKGDTLSVKLRDLTIVHSPLYISMILVEAIQQNKSHVILILQPLTSERTVLGQKHRV